MPNKSMLSLKYSWLGAGIFVLFSCYVAVSGVGVSSISHDINLAGSVSINAHSEQTAVSKIKIGSSNGSLKPSIPSSEPKDFVEVPLSAPVANFGQDSGVASKSPAKTDHTLENLKSKETDSSTTTTFASHGSLTGENSTPIKSGDKVATSSGTASAKAAGDSENSSSPTNYATSTTTTTTLVDGSRSNQDN